MKGPTATANANIRPGLSQVKSQTIFQKGFAKACEMSGDQKSTR
jgi:hypothetical protein